MQQEHIVLEKSTRSDKRTDWRTDKQTDRQTDKQADRQTPDVTRVKFMENIARSAKATKHKHIVLESQV